MTTPRRGAIRRALLASLTLAATAAVAAPAVAAPGDPSTRLEGSGTSAASADAAVAGANAAPSSCDGFSTYLDSNRRYGEIYLADGATYDYAWLVRDTGRLTYTPRAHTSTHFADDGSGLTTYGYAVAPGGTVQRWTRVFSVSSESVRTYRQTVATGWRDVRAIAGNGSFLYALRGDQLHRYTIAADRRLTDEVVVGGGYGNLQTLSWTNGSATADTLVAASRGGSLQRIKVSYRYPTTRNVAVLRRTGFAGFTSVSAGGCAGRATSLLAVSSTNRVYTFYDADGWDRDAEQAEGGLVGRVPTSYTVYSN